MVLALLGIQALAALIFIYGLKLPGRWAPAALIGFVVFSLPLLYIYWLQSGARQPSFGVAAFLVRPVFAWHFNWLAFLVFLAPLIGLTRLGAWITGYAPLVTGLRWTMLSIMGLWAVLSVAGLVAEVRAPRVESLTVTLPGLPAGEDGIRLAQLSDPHVSWWNSREEICRIGKTIAELKPDLFVITGDMVDHHPDYVYAMTDCLAEVKPRLGRFAIIGNHDVYTGREAVAKRMTERGFRMLRGQWVSLADRGSSLVVAGYDDSGRGWTGPDPAESEIPALLRDVPPDRPVILLAHRPSAFARVRGTPVGLQLSGHTHGGQLRLPFGGPGLADVAFAHPMGLYRQNGQTLYTTRGTGTVGWPFRLFCPAEITLITLRAPNP